MTGLGPLGRAFAQPSLWWAEAAPGHRQRAGHAPALLVLDEPASALDPGRLELAETLQWLRERSGGTVVLVEQDADLVARFADRLVVLVGGKILLDGSPRQLSCAPSGSRPPGWRLPSWPSWPPSSTSGRGPTTAS